MNFRIAAVMALAVTGFIHTVTAASGQIIYDSGMGWINSVVGDNGNRADNNYFAGSDALEDQVGIFRNHFDFVIPSFSGNVVSATLSLWEPSLGPGENGHYGGATEYSLYRLSAFGTYGFSDIGTGTYYGNVAIPASATGTMISIDLNSAALTDIASLRGSTFSLGGIDTGETAGWFDFAWSGLYYTSLTLTTQAPLGTPEPGTCAMAAALAVTTVAGICRRKRKAKS